MAKSNGRSDGNDKRQTKHHQIFDFLHEAIMSGRYDKGDRLPSEAAMARKFDTSRPTAARALRDLQQAGMVDRRVGAGTFVRQQKSIPSKMFGLLVPQVGDTEIFEPICSQIARAAQAQGHVLIWGHSSNEVGGQNEQAEQICQQYIDRNVAGVFFAPLELTSAKDEVNRRLTDSLRRAGIPVVLLDADFVPFPQRSDFDLVGIDNHRAGYIMVQYLLNLGYERVDFLSRPLSAATVSRRIRGYRAALEDAGITPDPDWTHTGDPDDAAVVQTNIDGKAEAIVCANDDTAAHLMNTLDDLGVKVPKDMGVVGIDDVRYAKLLRTPLTSLHQPCRAIGIAATNAMLERIANPQLQPREILLACDIVVRSSCGTRLPTG